MWRIRAPTVVSRSPAIGIFSRFSPFSRNQRSQRSPLFVGVMEEFFYRELHGRDAVRRDAGILDARNAEPHVIDIPNTIAVEFWAERLLQRRDALFGARTRT